MRLYQTKLREKLHEALTSVLPILAVVLALCFTVAPMPSGILLSFLVGAVLLVVGTMFFSLGAELAMSPMGERVGACITRSKNLPLMLFLGFLLGFLITVSEPDLQVLANQVPSVPNRVLIFTVAAGVGVFLCIAFLRMLFSIPLPTILLAFYLLVFALSLLVPRDFWAVAFDSGGVTTGPMTVPFIMALGVGVASIRSDANAQTDSFGLVALCSVGPILAVLLLSFIYKDAPSDAAASIVNNYATTVEMGNGYFHALPEYLLEVLLALLPIVVSFMIFQVVALKLHRLPLMRILLGLVLTCVGLVLFLTGANVGFSSLGFILGERLASPQLRFLLVPIAMVMGWFIINAEPAVHVLNKQVEELSAGAISAKAMHYALSIAVSMANGLAMLRVLTGMSIMWLLIPGYAVALVLAFFVPPTFTSIAFDSGGVASGPLTATFMLPFAMGACTAMGGNIMTDAFGLVALVAMMPLITVQIMGLIYVLKVRGEVKQPELVYGETDVIELWEV